MHTYKLPHRHILTIIFAIIIFLSLSAFTLSSQAQTPTPGASIVVDATAQTSMAEELLSRVQNSWPWYLTRASGLVAAVAMTLLMLSGIGFITGRTYAFIEPLTGWATHRSLGIILTISLLLHMIALYFDHFVPFSVVDLLVPFASQYQPVELYGISFGSLYVALGVAAFYLIVLIVLVSLIWVEGRTKAWKVIHLLSYLAMVFVFVHALFIGTDLAGGILRYVWIGLGVILLIASLKRLWRAYTV